MDALLNEYKDQEITLKARLESLNRARQYGFRCAKMLEKEAHDTLHAVISLRGQVERELEPLDEDQMAELEDSLLARNEEAVAWSSR